VASPVCTLLTVDGDTRVQPADAPGWSTGGDPLTVLREMLDRYAAGPHQGPFSGGAVGYYGYQLGRRFEGLAHRPSREPQMAVGIYRWALLVDRHRHSAWVCGADIDEGLARELALLCASPGPVRGDFRVTGVCDDALDYQAYRKAFGAVQRYIHEGDCYQVNLANRLRARYEGDPLLAYRWLRERAGGPFSAYLDLPHTQVLSLSPERFLRVESGRVETRPIKGTRPRRRSAARDERERLSLLASDKDRAENVMIVDLLRNDLGKVCRPGTVRVPRLCELESYSTVHHLVSRVVGELRPDCAPEDLLRACLPGGSITGAPKHRAMQIIDELEAEPRGVYCGSIGYIGFDGCTDLNIAIRTATCVDGVMDYWAGGGLVADSRCRAEYEETRDKARAFLQLLQTAMVPGAVTS
jgi:para-aminobenzoate synthetase component 1